MRLLAVVCVEGGFSHDQIQSHNYVVMFHNLRFINQVITRQFQLCARVWNPLSIEVNNYGLFHFASSVHVCVCV